MSYSLVDLSSTLGRLGLHDDEDATRSVQSPTPIKVEDEKALVKEICFPDTNTWDEIYGHKRGKVKKIERIQNYFLFAQYKLKQAHKMSSHGDVKELTLYHGTKACNIDSICKNNFAWRRMGSNGFRFSKFGRGVSFSPNVHYASDYPRRYNDSPRVMFVVKVLEVSRCYGDSDLEVPPEPDDVSASRDGNVVVKYYDDEFYPEYIISYE
ncbi:hypothetical protein JTB14_030373 [Gonioctena quinquepunctata]|nr:hypothetical protein JTB14_030373 [Gonioctena quinquepunctata]